MCFCERGKWREPGEELCTRIIVENKQTQKPHRVESGINLDKIGGRQDLSQLREHCSHHCAITTPIAAPTLIS